MNGPLFFRRSPQEMEDFIPAIPWNTQSVDPNRRDSQLRLVDRSAEYQADRPRWSFHVTCGALHSRGYMGSLDPQEINAALQAAWDHYGKDAVKSVVLYLNPSVLEDSYYVLLKRGFERAVSKEGGDVPQVVFVGPANKW